MSPRAAAAALAAATILLLACGSSVSAPMPAAHQDLPCPGISCVRAISWNVHGLPLVSAAPSARMDAIARRIFAERPDFVLLQEVWLSSYAERIAGPLHADYARVDAPAEGTGWPRGGLVVLVRRDGGWKVRGVVFHPYRDAAPWWRLDEGDGIAGKGYLVVRLARGAQRLVLLDTHLQAQYPEHQRTYERTRREQAAQLRRFVSASLGESPVLITGDFNTTPADPVFGAEIARLGDDVTRPERFVCRCGTVFDPQGRRGDWIDYVFARGLPIDLRDSQTALIENSSADHPYSDHDGLLARIVLLPVRR